VMSVGDFQKFSEARMEKIQPKQFSLWTDRKMKTNIFLVSNLLRLEVNEDWTDVILCGYHIFV
jgi:hypothetical protein